MRGLIFFALLVLAYLAYRSGRLDFSGLFPVSSSTPGQLGAPPGPGGTCPISHPIKGNFTTYSGEPCIYHVTSGVFYAKTWPERCYATEDEARRDGCRASKR